jgi:predicted nucleotidyltransferase
MNRNNSIVEIVTVYEALEELQRQVVFVGGACISFYASRQTSEVRPTDDVDVIIELLNYSDLGKLEKTLLRKGFLPDIYSGVICRYRVHGVTVDIIPTGIDVFGFSNKWYPEGYKNAIDHKIDEKVNLKILSAPYFLATKLEAFKGRGKEDGRTSQDIEDIVFVMENRGEIWEEISNLSGEIRNYLINEFTRLMNNPSISEWIDCHVERGSPPSTSMIIEKINKFIGRTGQ